MKDVSGYKEEDGHFIVDTGSPHYIKFVTDVNGCGCGERRYGNPI